MGEIFPNSLPEDHSPNLEFLPFDNTLDIAAVQIETGRSQCQAQDQQRQGVAAVVGDDRKGQEGRKRSSYNKIRGRSWNRYQQNEKKSQHPMQTEHHSNQRSYTLTASEF